jgi:hypothetical protein
MQSRPQTDEALPRSEPRGPAGAIVLSPDSRPVYVAAEDCDE